MDIAKPLAELSVAGALVLRDQARSEPLQVLVTAIDELITAGVWTTSTVRRRGWRRRLVVALEPATEVPQLSERCARSTPSFGMRRSP